MVGNWNCSVNCFFAGHGTCTMYGARKANEVSSKGTIGHTQFKFGGSRTRNSDLTKAFCGGKSIGFNRKDFMDPRLNS